MRLRLGQPWKGAVPWVVASLPFVFLVAWFWNRGPGFDADDFAQALMHAEALIEGRPYRDTAYIPTRLDLAPAVQPPGVPLLLAGAMLIGGGFHWSGVKLTMSVAAFPFFLLAGLYFARHHGRAMGLVIMLMLTVGLVAKAPAGAMHIQSDLGFAGLAWATLWLLDEKTELTWPRVLGIFLLTSAAMAFRFLGAALLPTIALYAILGRREGRSKLFAPLGVWAAGGLAVALLLGPSAIARQLSLDPARLWNSILPMIRAYSPAAVEAHLYPFPWDAANDVFHAVSLALAIVGLVSWTRTSWSSAAWLFTAMYLFTLLVASNRTPRYLIPLYPVLLFGLLHGVRIVVGTVRRAWSGPRADHVSAAVGAAVALAALALLLVQQPRSGGYLHDEPATQDLFARVAAEPPAEGKRVAFAQARVLAWSTGIPAMTLPGAEPEPSMAELERLRITHVILDRMELQPGRTRRMRATLAANECRFERVYDNGSFELHRVRSSCPAPTGGSE